MSSSVTVDQEARDMARDAQFQITAHEQVCTERYGNVIKTMGEIKSILWYGTVGLITTMCTLIGYLYTHPG